MSTIGKRNPALKPIHPGEILKTELMEQYGMTAHGLALDLGVPASRIAEIIHGRRSITADTAYRLGIYFGTSPEMWLDLQNRYDLETLEDEAAEEIRRRVRPRAG